MLSVIMLSVIMLSVVVPWFVLIINKKSEFVIFFEFVEFKNNILRDVI
jgi:hypothetical protein